MAHFYGGVRGQAKTEATRRGSPNSGLDVFANGWESGIEVETRVAHFPDGAAYDEHTVYLTGGSNETAPRVPVLILACTAAGIRSVNIYDPYSSYPASVGMPYHRGA